MTTSMTGHFLHDFQNLNFPRGEIIRKMGFAVYFQQAEIADMSRERTSVVMTDPTSAAHL